MRSIGIFAGVVLVALLVAFATAALADTIITKNGDKYEGYIVREDDKEIVINHKNMAEVTIKKSDIVEHTKGTSSTDSATDDKGDKTDTKSTGAKPGTTTTKPYEASFSANMLYCSFGTLPPCSSGTIGKALALPLALTLG